MNYIQRCTVAVRRYRQIQRVRHSCTSQVTTGCVITFVTVADAWGPPCGEAKFLFPSYRGGDRVRQREDTETVRDRVYACARARGTQQRAREGAREGEAEGGKEGARER